MLLANIIVFAGHSQ